jgi:hypothetical protein
MLSPTPDSLSGGYAPSEPARPSQLPVNAGAGSGPILTASRSLAISLLRSLTKIVFLATLSPVSIYKRV